MTQTKISGKFYPLQHNEWLRACQELKPAQKDVLYFIRTLDPYSDGVELSPAEIARSLSTESKIVHRSTVGRALKVLEEKGFIDLELLRVKVRVLGKGLHDQETSMSSAIPCCLETTVLPPDNLRDRDATKLPPDNLRDRDATSGTPECSQHNGFTHPYKTNKTLDQTLSEDERVEEKINNWERQLSPEERKYFRSFCKVEAERLPKAPVLLDSWITAHFNELIGLYRERYGKGKSSAAPVTQSNSKSIHNSKTLHNEVADSPKDSPQEELHSSIARGLKLGFIKKLDPSFDGLWTAEHGWMKQKEWIEQGWIDIYENSAAVPFEKEEVSEEIQEEVSLDELPY